MNEIIRLIVSAAINCLIVYAIYLVFNLVLHIGLIVVLFFVIWASLSGSGLVPR